VNQHSGKRTCDEVVFGDDLAYGQGDVAFGEPLERGLEPYTAWVTGMRREDAPTRTDITVVGWDAKRGKVKLNPLAAWTQADVDAYVDEHHVVLNPLRQAGYASIGCAPCTRAVAPGEDPRAGRWSGTSKIECGLHT